MRTKQLFFSFLSLLLIIACSNDDSILNDESIDYKPEKLSNKRYTDLDNIDNDFGAPTVGRDGFSSSTITRSTRIRTGRTGLVTASRSRSTRKNCVYGTYAKVYYSTRFPDLGNYKVWKSLEAQTARDSELSNIKFNRVINGCKKYIIPETPNFIYDQRRGQYYEIWRRLGDSGKPGSDYHEIEL